MRELIAQVKAGAWDPDANLVPILAAEIPSLENGGLAVDGRSVVWRLKQGMQCTTASRLLRMIVFSTGSTPRTPKPPR
jgi:hypothetical protein